jgi:6-phosphogluconolactonase (cycloisomerase 2 family)
MFQVAMLCVSAASAQIVSSQTSTAAQPATTTGPAAYVYVSSGPTSTGKNVVNAFAAAANGKLTLVPGSPFHDDVTYMVVNGKYLFGSTRSGIYVAAFLMQSNGALHWTTSTNVSQYNPDGCVSSSPPVLDHTGADLYRPALVGGLCESSEYQSFNIDKTTGKLKLLGSSAQKFLFNTPLSFSGNNIYAYGSDCINYKGNYLDTFQALRRESNGFLADTSFTTNPPPSPSSSEFYCRSLTAADPTNHVAVAVQLIDFNTSSTVGLPQLATYTSASSGNLTTTSTQANMPKTATGFVLDLAMSPSGKLLAVAGTNGLQIFHFNGSTPLTAYTGLLTSMDIEQAYWDNQNHLYAVSQNGGRLFVFTVTPTSASQASGSPYVISHPRQMIVQPKTP